MTLKLWLILGGAGALLAFLGGSVWLHGRWVSSYRETIIQEIKAESLKAENDLRKQLSEKEGELRRVREDLANARQEADEAKKAEAKTVIKEIIRDSPSAASCRFDGFTADRLNRLRSN